MSATTFNLHTAVLASLSPVLERDPEVLRPWADNLDQVAAAYDERGHTQLAARKRVRAAHLRSIADAEGVTA
jgi:hypothetical protein